MLRRRAPLAREGRRISVDRVQQCMGRLRAAADFEGRARISDPCWHRPGRARAISQGPPWAGYSPSVALVDIPFGAPYLATRPRSYPAAYRRPH